MASMRRGCQSFRAIPMAATDQIPTVRPEDQPPWRPSIVKGRIGAGDHGEDRGMVEAPQPVAAPARPQEVVGGRTAQHGHQAGGIDEQRRHQDRIAIEDGKTDEGDGAHDTQCQAQRMDDAIRQNLAREQFAAQPWSRKLRSIRDRLGCFSLRNALASIWRMRSRVTENCWPTSSSVWSVFMPMPKRMRSTRSSRGVSVASTRVVLSRRLPWMRPRAG